MDNIDWESLKYFKRSEFKHPDKMNRFLIYRLEEFRRRIGHAIVIHSDYREGDKGYHGKGDAVDVHIKDIPLSYAYILAERSGLFNGIGIYPAWNHPGLHLDIRSGDGARWGSWNQSNHIYVPLNEDFFLRLMKEGK